MINAAGIQAGGGEERGRCTVLEAVVIDATKTNFTIFFNVRLWILKGYCQIGEELPNVLGFALSRYN